MKSKKPRSTTGAYDHKIIESKWQKKWSKSKIYKTKESGDAGKFYILDMFPYPSGEGLHVGHPKGYIATDIISRMNRMQGKNVLHPMGFDAFGLPAENYALKTKTHPEIAVKNNVARYKKQLEILGFDYDWSREVNTTDPKYYKWTQWIFLKLLEKGLAFESYEPINWCPSCKTGLANEDIEDGRCERCGTVVEKKPMRQWVLRITDYAERLLGDLEAVDGNGKKLIDWPNSIKELQKNWIGKSEGAEIDFGIENSNKKIKVFTTRPDTLFGVSYVVLAPEHEWVGELLPKLENKNEVEQYINRVKNETETERTDAGKEKTGVQLKGVFAINPVNNEKVPVWIADYVLADYGTGAVMAVPAHDQRDFEFAKKFGLPVKQVIAPFFIDPDNKPIEGKNWSPRKNIMVVIKHPSENKIIQLKWKEVPWKTFVIGGVDEGESYEEAAKREVMEETGYYDLGAFEKLGWQMESHFYAKHKDINRQAFPQVFICKLNSLDKKELNAEENAKHEVSWVDFKPNELEKTFWPVSELSQIKVHLEKGLHAYENSGKLINSDNFNGKNSELIKKEITEYAKGKWVNTYKLRDWVFSRQRYWGEPIPVIHCEKCGVVAVPEKDLPVKLPKVKSYEPTGTGESPLAGIDKWVNTKCPNCKGKAKRETNTMPQWAGSSWYYLRYMDPKNNKKLVDPKKESYWSPVDFYVGGAEHATRHLIYARFWHKFLYDIGAVTTIEPFAKLQHVGLIMGEDGRKMSKRFGNVVNPDDIVERFGADTMRVYEMFMGPFDQQIAWSTDSMVGSRRFIERVWKLKEKVRVGESSSQKIETLVHRTVKKVTEDIQSMKFNTAISSLMIAINDLEKFEYIPTEVYSKILQLIAPFAPHVADELWSSLGNKKSIHISDWPKYDPAKIVDQEVTIVIQINGKTRSTVTVAKDASESIVKDTAMTQEEVKKWLNGAEIMRIVFVQNKLINIVIKM